MTLLTAEYVGCKDCRLQLRDASEQRPPIAKWGSRFLTGPFPPWPLDVPAEALHATCLRTAKSYVNLSLDRRCFVRWPRCDSFAQRPYGKTKSKRVQLPQALSHAADSLPKGLAGRFHELPRSPLPQSILVRLPGGSLYRPNPLGRIQST
jgi:hypothetical protein